MIPEERLRKEEEFNAWLESIKYVDSEGNVLPVELTPDESPDPEYDRGEPEEEL